LNTKKQIRQLALQHPAVCEWHIDPPCNSPAKILVNAIDGKFNVCEEAAKEIREKYPDAVTDEKVLGW